MTTWPLARMARPQNDRPRQEHEGWCETARDELAHAIVLECTIAGHRGSGATVREIERITRWLEGYDFSREPSVYDLALDWLYRCGAIDHGSRLWSHARV